MNRKYFIGLIVILLWISLHPLSGHCQIKTSVTFSNPWINKARSVNEDSKEYKKYISDSLKSYRKLEKFYKHRLDSVARSIAAEAEKRTTISSVDIASLHRLKKLQKEYNSKTDSIGSINDEYINEDFKRLYKHKSDSIQLLINRFTTKHLGLSTDEISRYNLVRDSLVNINKLPLDSIKLNTPAQDSLLLGLLTEHLEEDVNNMVRIEKLQMEQQRMFAEQDRLDVYKADFNRYRDKKNLKSNLHKLSKTELASKNKTLNSAHKTLSTYKKKYLTLPSTKHLEGGTKRNSLEGKSFWERIRIGGNLRINQRDKVVNIDFAPSIAYLANKKLAIGTEFVYRGEFGNSIQWYRAFDSETYGGRIFTDYTIYKSFFVHAELENLYTIPRSKRQEVITKISVPGAMAGMGKTFGLGKNVRGKMLIQYNFIHDETKELYASPWVVRFGFELKKLKKSELW